MQAPIIINKTIINITARSNKYHNPHNTITSNKTNGNITYIVISNNIFDDYEIMRNEINESPIRASFTSVFIQGIFMYVIFMISVRSDEEDDKYSLGRMMMNDRLSCYTSSEHGTNQPLR